MGLLLEHFGLDMGAKQYSEEQIWEVVLTAAASQTTIQQVCKGSAEAPCGNTVRGILHSQLSLEEVEAQANKTLAEKLPKRLAKKPRWLAIDLVLVPYHGQPAHKPDEVVRSQAKSGTTHFHAYATAFVVERERRFTLALTFVRSTDCLTDIVDRLESRVKQLAISIRCRLLDRQFFTVEVIRHLKEARKSFIIPVIIRGKKSPPGGTRVLVEDKRSGWKSYTLRSSKKGEVSLRVAVVARNWAGRMGKQGRRMLPYAVYGVRTELREVASVYRLRFGIETSHRQMNQARGRTASRSPVLRLLYVGIAFMLRNLWAWLHWAVVAEPRRGRRKLRLWLMSLEQMLNWIAGIGREKLKTVRKIPVGYALTE
jgi:putative transposase